jgi:hypothetical protein
MIATDTPASTKSDRVAACLLSLFAAFMISNLSYQLYWNRQQNQRLYEFSTRASAPLVPVECKMMRGAPNSDFIVAYGRRINSKPTHAKACWYAIDRFKALFPEYKDFSEGSIMRQHYDAMKFRQKLLRPTPPSMTPLFGIPIGIFIGLIGILQLFFGSIKRSTEEPAEAASKKIDADKLKADLAKLRKNLTKK